MPSESVWFLRLRRVMTGGIVTRQGRFRPDMKIRFADFSFSTLSSSNSSGTPDSCRPVIPSRSVPSALDNLKQLRGLVVVQSRSYNYTQTDPLVVGQRCLPVAALHT